MPEIKMTIQGCAECPHAERTRLYTEDSWEHAEDFWCKKTPAEPRKEQGRQSLPFKLIAGYVEWPSEFPKVPDWCPLQVAPSLGKPPAKWVGRWLESQLGLVDLLGPRVHIRTYTMAEGYGLDGPVGILQYPLTTSLTAILTLFNAQACITTGLAARADQSAIVLETPQGHLPAFDLLSGEPPRDSWAAFAAECGLGTPQWVLTSPGKQPSYHVYFKGQGLLSKEEWLRIVALALIRTDLRVDPGWVQVGLQRDALALRITPRFQDGQWHWPTLED